MAFKKLTFFCRVKRKAKIRKNKSVLLFAAFSVCLLLQGCSRTQDLDTAGGAADIAQTPPIETLGELEVFAAGFYGADGIAIDNSGNMYVGNRSTNIISKVSPAGDVTEFVSLGCQELLCMTTDEENNLYAAGGDQVFKISPQGDVRQIGTGFTCADDVRLDEKGNLYVTDSFENRVYKITPALEKSVFIESDISQSELTRSWYITGVSFDHTFENLYIARMQNGEILKYPIGSDGLAGAPTVVAAGLSEPDHLEMDAQGRLYITLFRTGSLIRVDPSGETEVLCDGKMGYATGIALGRSGFDERYAYIADYGRDQVVRIYIGES